MQDSWILYYKCMSGNGLKIISYLLLKITQITFDVTKQVLDVIREKVNYLSKKAKYVLPHSVQN